MKPLFENGFVCWNEQEIVIRENLITELSLLIKDTLTSINPSWRYHRTETPTLIPRGFVAGEYASDVFMLGDKALRPETTKGSYAVAQELLAGHNGIRLPLCVWQAGKSFRNEQDKTLKNMRLKEFWQLEFQCIYSKTTGADYRTPVIDALSAYLGATVEESDRLPVYSTQTTDLIIDGMEVASISTRTDYNDECKVLEIALGLDRLVYQRVK